MASESEEPANFCRDDDVLAIQVVPFLVLPLSQGVYVQCIGEYSIRSTTLPVCPQCEPPHTMMALAFNILTENGRCVLYLHKSLQEKLCGTEG